MNQISKSSIMKRKFPVFIFSALLALGAASCSDDNNGDTPDPDMPENTLGVYVLNNGNMGKKIEGDITYYDYTERKAFQNIFQNANGRSLGNSPQCAVVYGSKMYVGVYESNTIEVIDRNTYKSIKQIPLAGRDASMPRGMVARDGKVYVSMYSGYVSRLDTLSLAIDKDVKVGPNPEKIAILGNYLYVPNSDGMSWNTTGYGKTASRINLDTFSTAENFEVGLNPTKFVTDGSSLFLLCMGNYGDVPATVYKVDPSDLKSTEIGKFTLMAADSNYLYLINAPYGVDKISYQKYNIATGAFSDMISDEGVESPADIAVDPRTGNIFITSYVIENGYANYAIDGYARFYDASGANKGRFTTGVGPVLMFFSMR